MKAGDLVIILYERTRYYIIVQALGKEFPGEERFKLIGTDGHTRYALGSEIRLVSESR